MNIFETLQNKLGEKVKKDFILAPYTTFKMGGQAEYYFLAETIEEMVAAYHAPPRTVIGIERSVAA